MILEHCPWHVAEHSMGLLVVCLRAMLNKGVGGVGGAEIVFDALISLRIACNTAPVGM
jgi:hypothetical protein